MGFIIAVLSATMVLLCLVLLSFVLIQTPKTDALAGLDIPEAVAEMPVGLQSTSALIELTRYAAAAFMLLALFLSFLQNLPLR